MLVAVVIAPSAGDAYLGTQGDIWDAQKDMALAGCGALLCMLITALGPQNAGKAAGSAGGDDVRA